MPTGQHGEHEDGGRRLHDVPAGGVRAHRGITAELRVDRQRGEAGADKGAHRRQQRQRRQQAPADEETNRPEGGARFTLTLPCLPAL